MKEQEWFINEPTREDIAKQYNEIVKMTKNVFTKEDIVQLQKNNSDFFHENLEEIEINYEDIKNYKGGVIYVIRYEYKNILFYVNIEDNKTIPDEYIGVYWNEGWDYTECNYNDFEIQKQK